MQAIFAVVVLAVAAFMVAVAQANLASQDAKFGFDFLFSVTGWDVGSSLIAHSSQDPYWRTFLVGVLNTCFAAAICVTLASILGTVVGLLAVSDNPLISGPCLLYVNAIRNIPQILLVFLFYHACLQLPPARESLSLFGATFLNNRGLYAPSLELRERGIWLLPWALTAVLLCWLVLRLSRRLGAGSWREAIPLGAASLVGFCAVVALLINFGGAPAQLVLPQLKGFNFQGGFVLAPEFVALVTAITLYNAAFMAEIIRAGILSVPKGQIEAGRSLGLSNAVCFRKIILPQAIRVVVPPMTSQIISITKSTSLAVAIAFTELFSVATIAIANTGRSFENVAILMVVYMALSAVIALAGEAISRVYRWPGSR